MVEAGIIAVAILVVGGFGIFSYRNEHKKDRAAAHVRSSRIHESVLMIRDRLDGRFVAQIEAIGDLAHYANRLHEDLAPLCESLAESLQAQMSTIDREMADLRTRVETGPGKRTLRV